VFATLLFLSLHVLKDKRKKIGHIYTHIVFVTLLF